MFLLRAVIVIALLLAVALVARLYRQWRSAAPTALPLVPGSLLAGANRTWVVFTSPFCATCGPVADRLRAADPGARLVQVDATREPHLADAFSVRSAPTVLLADAGGRVRARLVGAEAVDDYVRSPQ